MSSEPITVDVRIKNISAVPYCTVERKNRCVDISILKGIPSGKCGSRAARVASRGGQEKEAIVTVYVLYCFDARGLIVVRYCFKWGLFDV